MSLHEFEDSSYDENASESSKIFAAVDNKDLESLRTLLYSPKLYGIKDCWGCTLLHSSMLNESVEIFDYFLSLEGYPLGARDDHGNTALMTVLNDDYHNGEYFALELIKKGCDVDEVTDGEPLLHCAFKMNYLDVAKLLIKKGVDIDEKNDDGHTPLHACCLYCHHEILVEGILMLLYFGADPTVRDYRGRTAFDMILTYCDRDIQIAQQNLFYYLFDEHTRYSIDAGILLKAAMVDSQFFEVVVRCVDDVFINGFSFLEHKCLFRMRIEHLQVFIQKFDYIIQAILHDDPNKLRVYSLETVCLNNICALLESKFQAQVIGVEGIVQNFIEHEQTESSLTVIVCTLLMYGMKIYTKDLDLIFKKFGYCELFKILLHMDIDEESNDNRHCGIMTRILYDVSLDIQKIIDNPDGLSIKNVREILPFYAIPKRIQLYSDILILHKDVFERIENQPQIPHLVELSRNAFRKYFIEKFNIRHSRQFYTLINRLPISAFHKKIITLEVPLYY